MAVVPTIPPSPRRTIADLATGAMAFEGARFGKKMLAADKDARLHSARMNAVCDAQAEKFGASSPLAAKAAGESPDSLGGDDAVEVFTNSPVTDSRTINHNYPSPDAKSQMATITTVAGMFGLLLLAVLLMMRPSVPVTPPVPPTPTPNPVPTPAADWDIDITVK
jgi:hypothetical protein